MIDGATADEDKVTPVYKLEEICDLLRSSHSSIVKEVSEFILRRLDHKSPIVKQKGLRVIKYAVGKSGVEFRREMQRNSVAVRQLIHYKGQPDPLKGDALNKAVRATAQEALSAIFSAEENNKAVTSAVSSPSENLTKRIQGFGNTNYEMTSSSSSSSSSYLSDDKKSFLSEVVGIGSATIKQGFNSLTQSPSVKKNDVGSYRSPNLRRSLTTEGYENQQATQFPISSSAGAWASNYENSQAETTTNYNHTNNISSREERLLETIVTSGGVRLQPTRDAIHIFLMEVPKLDALVLSHALESKLKSHLWQVRVKAVCVLEAILRNKDNGNLAIISSYFSENRDVVVKCSEFPQASLREKAIKVLSLLDPGTDTVIKPTEENSANAGNSVNLPDLIDTGDSNDSYHESSGVNKVTNQIDDLFGGGKDIITEQIEDENDPFADVSFHINNDKQNQQQKESISAVDPFAGLNIDDQPVNGSIPQNFNDIFGSTVDHNGDINDLMGNINISVDKTNEPLVNIGHSQSNPMISNKGDIDINDLMANINMSVNKTNESPVNIGEPQSNQGFPMAYTLPAGMMFNPVTFASQQQFLATMSNFHTQNPAVTSGAGGYISALPDIFQPVVLNQPQNSTMMNTSKKEDTRAFDFISDHLAAARDPKKVI
jgi:hypothetical protein